MDKNPNKVKISDIFSSPINSILCHDAFVKEFMIQKIIQEYKTPIIYLDFDLLYSGYIQSGMIKNQENVVVFSPKKDRWNHTLKEIMMMISNQTCVVIIDSLNGFFALFDERRSGRYVNSCMMILASLTRHSKGTMFLTSVAQLKEKDVWILRPTGRRVLENRSMTRFFVSDSRCIEKLD